ncbi:MAG: hypothetical protein Q4C54_06005 [Clostridia bacterium]|nr:hypothetical protein [Clostridia bacterium]
MARLIGRILVLLAAIAVFLCKPQWLDVLHGWRFFESFSPLHLLWCIWLIDMVYQLIPVKKKICLGSQKLFRFRFKPASGKLNRQSLQQHIITTTKAAYKVFILWGLVIVGLGILFHRGILTAEALFLVSVVFYVCDLICVLIWCPFRLIMKNRCCTTCRIFNWDHLMMFTPMLYVAGFYAYSLLAAAIVVWLVWELSVILYPERFWEQSNEALTCANCTDKLCTQYCQKLRKD